MNATWTRRHITLRGTSWISTHRWRRVTVAIVHLCTCHRRSYIFVHTRICVAIYICIYLYTYVYMQVEKTPGRPPSCYCTAARAAAREIGSSRARAARSGTMFVIIALLQLLHRYYYTDAAWDATTATSLLRRTPTCVIYLKYYNTLEFVFLSNTPPLFFLVFKKVEWKW